MTAITRPSTETPTPIDVPHAHATLTAAFVADPVIRWIYPDPLRYLTHFPDLVRVLAAPAFTADAADGVLDGAGAALWVPPGAPSDDEAMVRLLQESIDAHRHIDAFAFLEQVNVHHPTEPHWYLPTIGVDPACQGRGLGSTLLRFGLQRSDADHVGAYLEASSARNRALYERHGFQVRGEIQAADSPPLWPMWRSPAS